jgi:hypothetical protein
MNSEILRTKIIDLIHAKPKIAQKVTRLWLESKSGTQKLAELAEFIDWDVAFLMMDWVSPEVWLSAKASRPVNLMTSTVPKEFIQTITTLELQRTVNPENFADPFEILNTLDQAKLKLVLGSFTPEEWALTSAYRTKEELLTFARNFKPADARSFIAALERLKKIPKESLMSTANGFSHRVNLFLRSDSTTEAKESTHFVYSAPNPEVLVKDAVEIFARVSRRESEMEAQVTRLLDSIDPELSARLTQILKGSDSEEIIVQENEK